MRDRNVFRCVPGCLWVGFFLVGSAAVMASTPLPKDATPWDTAERPVTWNETAGVVTSGDGDWIVRELAPGVRVHLEYAGSETGGAGRFELKPDIALTLGGVPGEWQSIDIAAEHPRGTAGLIRVWRNGAESASQEIPIRAESGRARYVATAENPAERVRFDGNFSLLVRFRTTDAGTLVAMAPATGPWVSDAKALFIRDGRLVYDIGWLGEYEAGPVVNDGRWHTAALVAREGTVTLHLDGAAFRPRRNFSRPDIDGHVLKIGSASSDFGGDFSGEIDHFRYYRRALSSEEVARLTGPEARQANTPDFEWRPGASGDDRPALRLSGARGTRFRNLWTQPLDGTDHAALIRGWNEESLARGSVIYGQLCVVCHGTLEAPGSLPTALRFAEGMFKNGADPRSMYETLTRGFGQMVAQPQYTSRQKYDVIHYIRETFLKKHPSQFAEIDDAYLAGLPIGQALREPEVESTVVPPYQRMDFGPALFWTLEAAKGNIAQKGVAIRLDDGPGGVSRGRDWMLYDNDTLRVAAAWSGPGFVDWKGIAFDGSHQTHTSLSGVPAFLNPPGPGWANPADGSWQDPRPLDRSGRPYGPLPREWARFRGAYLHGSHVILSVQVGGTDVLDSPSLIPYGSVSVFVRTINLGPSTRPLALRVAPDSGTVAVVLRGDGASLERRDGFAVVTFPQTDHPRQVRIYAAQLDAANLQALAAADTAPLDLAPLTHGGPRRWDKEVVTRVVEGERSGAFAIDTLTLPDENPWQAWMRATGFDFYPDGKSAALCTWNGDVWRVDGVDGTGELRWRRLVSGLFQPLGVKIRDGSVFVCCRDQIARLHDTNGDGETDFVEAFNGDHQVTEHFHEFAMGLQTDAAGNFYYAKSARHALPALVPHHGTLLRVSADGSRTDIVAHGFRAANGVCLNDDGSFFVTDQEGHWTPKNRINHVVPDGGFYGNMFGYTEVTDTADSAMRQPMVWITNQKDRSPAELVRVPKGTWGRLEGSLLNLSYGYGRIYVVPHESVEGQLQGGVCELPIPDFPTGVMRGRFHPDGSLFACGMVGWATNCSQDGGFYRLRPTGNPVRVPVALASRPGALDITFSDPLDASVESGQFQASAWGLRRSANYGSAHLNEQELAVTGCRLHPDRRTVTLEMPALAPTRGMEVRWNLRDAQGAEFAGALHLTLHALGGLPKRP